MKSVNIFKFIKRPIGLIKLLKTFLLLLWKQFFRYAIIKGKLKGLWRRIEINGDQTLGELDEIIREAFNYDPWDHLSMFFSGRAWKSDDFGQIEPGGQDVGAKTQINQLSLSEGDKLEYVYDFGDKIKHIITLEKIKESEISYQTPCIKNDRSES